MVSGLLALAVARPQSAGDDNGTQIQIYRDQLAEVDRDAERGVLDADEAGRLRLEVSRRLLDADKVAQSGRKSNASGSPVLAWLIVVLVFGGGYLLYNRLGVPGSADWPLETRHAEAENVRANRPSQVEIEAGTPSQSVEASADPAHLELMKKLRTALKTRPDDIHGHTLLAENEALLGNFTAAKNAQEQVLRIKGDAASVVEIANYIDLLVLSAGGYVSPQAELAIGKVLEMQPENGTGRYYLGLMYAQTGRPDLAFNLWRNLLESSDPGAPWVPPIRAQIEIAASDAGVEYSLPTLAGPTQEEIDAVQSMSAEDRDEMVRSMVAQLSERLAQEGGTAKEWAQLIGALGVLGETERASAIWAESQGVFGSDPIALKTLLDAARQAGVAN